MKSILFYWSKGAEVRRELVVFIYRRNRDDKPCFLNLLAKHLKLTHPAVKKHLDLLIEGGYIEQLNPESKPIYLRLTSRGRELAEEFVGKGKK